MPYIKIEDRNKVDDLLHELGSMIENEGELNYCISTLAILLGKKLGRSYSTYNKLIGAFECAKLEFYRRCIAPYEDIKIKENGDIDYS